MFNQNLKKEDLELIKKLYQLSIQYLDKKIEELFNRLEREFKDSIIIITADHGQLFGEHEGFGHSPHKEDSKLYKELLHVPLIIRIPNKKGKIINKVVSCAQIPATILKLVGIEPAKEMEPSLFDGRKIKVYSESLLDCSLSFDYFDLTTIQKIVHFQ